MTPPPTMTTRDVGVGGDVETIARNCIAATRPFRSPKGREQAQPKGPTPERVCPSATCHSERNCHSERPVIPSDTELSFRATPNCHSERSRGISPRFFTPLRSFNLGHPMSFRADTNSHRLAPGCRLRFFTPLRSVQNDMTWAIRCHSERTRTVIPSDLSFRANCHSERLSFRATAELSFRAKPRNLTASHRDAASDSSLRCAPFRMT